LIALVAGAFLARPAYHLLRVLWEDPKRIPPMRAGYLDDASRLNSTELSEVWDIPSDTAAAEKLLATLLARAKRDGLPVSIAGARHSMGGHTFYPNGIVVNMRPFTAMHLDEASDILHVQTGATWAEIIPFLDERGRSVAVMQSNNSFTVGGSISVNCHGWQYGRPPIASTVEAFRIMTADGAIHRCSREENTELFSLALGGYGLFGIILDAELRVVPNERLRLEQFIIPAEQALGVFNEKISNDPTVSMAYARLNIVPETLFEEVVVNVFHHEPDGQPPALSAPGLTQIRRAIFLGSAESDYGKELRWTAETKLQPHLRDSIFSRNQLLNESVDIFQNRSPDSTDILHEYFVPNENAASFVLTLGDIVKAHDANLLNVTVRSIHEDADTFLRYADGPMFAFVMLFNQARTTEADAEMEAMTQGIIDTALDHGGRYYLPYRLHARPEQFRKAYPQSEAFFRLKAKYDPDEIFKNAFYKKYKH
jgi:FAD/FMN-containing dehydrogenase